MAESFDRRQWLDELEGARLETTDYYLNEFNWRGTPVPAGFGGPRFYPPSERWRVAASLDREAAGTGSHIELPTSIGDMREFEVYGTFIFNLGGQEHRLTAYTPVPPTPYDDGLFVPFRDATSGKETYAAGRYLDVARREGPEYMLDFNMAYNPSCAYSPRYNCPYPPPQNHLSIAIEAGEKIPYDH